MEMELFSNLMSEEDTTLQVDVQNDDFSSMGERCGICMDIVVDRGVLDCCQHWFCFVCIDNWATITNLCPLCQNAFQLITCVPVYDTISTNKTDDYSDLRDADWYAEENNGIPSFPSYYIDENAVACLDGDGCKIRSGLVTFEDAPTLDTSIACDSCDIWYHAFCVEFDTEGTGVDSWLCPRCLNEAKHKSERREMHNAGCQFSLENGNDLLVDMTSGKLSVSVADDGETALVISRIDDQDTVKGPAINCQSNENYNIHQKVERSIFDQGNFSPVKLKDVKSEPSEGEPSASLDMGFYFTPIASEGDMDGNLLVGEKCPHDPSDENHVADGNRDDAKAELVPKIRDKRKRDENSVQTNGQDERFKIGLVRGSSTKKEKVQKCIRGTSLNDKADVLASNKFLSKKNGIRTSVDQVGELQKAESIDILSIVKGTESKILYGPAQIHDNDKCAKLQKNAALRVKKILRRPNDVKESAEVVQKLRKEIREAVHKKSVDDPGKSIVDPNLLAAFRAAVAEPSKKASPVDVKSKKLMLQKGKPRENLTKKIYATSNGKRRRAWDRDCEVEFWKHRCLTTANTEKIATLKSVLNLLQNKPDNKVVEGNSAEATEAPILSRLYLADTSLFPRKDDIKPLSVLRAATVSSHIDVVSLAKKDNTSAETNKLPAESSTPCADEKNKKSCSNLKNGVASGRLHSGGLSDKSSPLKKITGKTGDVKIDKRKWALEVLARKTASNSSSPVHQKQNDEVLKGHYPLLAELPSDMRPKLAPIRQNKIPASVRQAQLYRLTEVFLKMTNVSPIRRTAAVELAVADATNVEKQIADRSNSKVVYLNLCSQELRRHSSSSSSAATECTPSCSLAVPAEEEQSSGPTHNSETEAVLRAAGLLSDSPPSSPLHKVKDVCGGASPLAEVREEEIENILEMDSHPDLDIYGDFEYDLDEEYIGAPAVNSMSQAEDGESKVKVVLSTLNLSRSDNASEVMEQVPSTSSMPVVLNDVNTSSNLEDKKDSVPSAGDTSLDSQGEELSVAECEVLYGPDKEPLAKKLPELVSADNLTLTCIQNIDLRDSEKKNSTADGPHSATVGGSSPSCTQAIESHQEGKTSDLKVEKKIDRPDSVLKKVEAYVKEHLRPFCKSGVITVDQYRWAVGKTTDKVMMHHSKAKNANFLIKEGEKVKKLAAQYVETAAKHKENK